MKTFPTDIKFKYNWRKYQKRVLDDLKEHLTDNHLHIIAPPGSGKTILGLEVAVRLNKPTLVLVPSIAIRNQWEQRFVELFLQVEVTPNWISHDIKNPKFLTVSTYQGLHAVFSNTAKKESAKDKELVKTSKTDVRKSEKEIILAFKKLNLGTIVIDEAHHLKNAWWRSLNRLKKALKPTIVGLTATPPYDVSYNEWQRYLALNGPVDTEISIPDLVMEGNLCPHQDFVIFSKPTDEEIHKIYEYRNQIKKLFEEIKADTVLIDAIKSHPIFTHPKAFLSYIYSNLKFYSASLIFLHAVGVQIDSTHLEVIGDENYQIPELTYEWMEILLSFYLFKDPDNFDQYESHQVKLLRKLKRDGVAERTSINFIYNRKINNYLSTSVSKLQSIDTVVDFEYNQLGKNLRMVILTDYIRKELLVTTSENNLELNKMGVIPIFEQLRRSNDKSMRIAVLTGSVVIISETTYSLFKKTAKKEGLLTYNATPLSYDSSFLIIRVIGANKHKIVAVITKVFQEGAIDVLIGTKSLLGEGWDAPAINSLILASFVGSFVLSNQMRGRAIRTQINNKNKTGNIWHLACADPTNEDGGLDVQLLKRRFKTFVGISFDDEIGIENGIQRLQVLEKFNTDQDIKNANQQMFLKAGERNLLKERWEKALAKGVNLVEEIRIPFKGDANYSATKKFYYQATLKNLFITLGVALSGFGLDTVWGFVKNAGSFGSTRELIYWLLFSVGLGLMIFGKKTHHALKTYIKYRDISKDVHGIAQAVLASLIYINIVKTAYSNLKINTSIDKKGAIYCHLEGGSSFEKSTFIKAVQELIETIENPKYIIIRKSFLLNILSQKDYHAVPEILGKNKETAINFRNNWIKYVGSCELIFTRTLKGRKLLLKSRLLSLSAQINEEGIERVNRWH